MKVPPSIWKIAAFHRRKFLAFGDRKWQRNNLMIFRFTHSSGPASKIIVKFCIAVSCGIIGAIFTFPGLRMARMHWDSLKYCRENKFLQLLLNISFVLPFILVILWIKPISRENLTNRVFSGMTAPLWVLLELAILHYRESSHFTRSFPDWRHMDSTSSVCYSSFWLSFFALRWCRFTCKRIWTLPTIVWRSRRKKRDV